MNLNSNLFLKNYLLGRINIEDKDGPEQVVTLPFVTHEDCKNLYSNFTSITDKQVIKSNTMRLNHTIKIVKNSDVCGRRMG